MTTHETEGIVIRVTEFRETDRIVLFYTRDLGKISTLARHAIKSQKRFGTQLTVFQLLRLNLKQKPHRQLAILERVRPVTSLGRIFKDWRRIAAACVVADLANEMTREGSVNPRIYDVCRQALVEINDNEDWKVALAQFEYQLLEASGFQPTVSCCVSCRNPWRAGESAYWVHGAGGTHCRHCLPAQASFEIIRPEFLEPLQAVAKGEADPAAGVRCAGLLYKFIRYQLGRPLRSWQFLEETSLI